MLALVITTFACSPFFASRMKNISAMNHYLSLLINIYQINIHNYLKQHVNQNIFELCKWYAKIV